MVFPILLALPTTLTGFIFLIVALVIFWVIISIPVYFAGKAITGGKTGLGEAMGATLGGGLAYIIVYYGVALLLGALFGSSAIIFGFILGLIAWLAVYRASFETSWIGAIGIVVLAWLILIVLDFFLVQLVGVTFPNFLPF